MELLKKINENLFDFQIQSLDSIENNKGLEQLIYTIRTTLYAETSKTKEEIDAYFKTAIILFNNLEKPYWRDSTDNSKFSDYFSSKMDITFGGESKTAINSLINLWETGSTTNIEYNLRGIEVIVRESRCEFDKSIISSIIQTLKPLIERTEEKLVNNN